jgi:hypothetical protein
MAKSQPSMPETTAMQMVKNYVYLLPTNALVLYLANMWFANEVVLGTASLSLWWSIGMSAGKLTLVAVLATPLIEAWGKAQKRVLSTKDWMMAFLAINFAALWVITRFPEQFGIGVTSWVVVLIMAVVLDIVQGFVMMMAYKQK